MCRFLQAEAEHRRLTNSPHHAISPPNQPNLGSRLQMIRSQFCFGLHTKRIPLFVGVDFKKV